MTAPLQDNSQWDSLQGTEQAGQLEKLADISHRTNIKKHLHLLKVIYIYVVTLLAIAFLFFVFFDAVGLCNMPLEKSGQIFRYIIFAFVGVLWSEARK